MSEIEELKVHIESLETHVARLEGILYVASYRVGLVESDEKKRQFVGA